MKKIARELLRIAEILSPSEALFGFGGWLTSREEEITLPHDASEVAEAIAEFMSANDLEEPRDGWHYDYVNPDMVDNVVMAFTSAKKKKEPKKPTKEEIERRKKKTISVKKMAESINGLRSKLTRDMKSDDEKTRLTATAIAIMDCTAERVGNDSSANDSDHVGVTGFKKKNVTVNGNKVTLKYVGKSGVEHEKDFTDERIAKVLKECLKRAKKPNDFVLTSSDGYKLKGDRVNRYLKDYGVTAKDIRGYSANHMVVNSLKNRKTPRDEKERKEVMMEVLQKVAESVGHGKATLRTHYLLPGIEDDYIKSGKIKNLKKASVGRVADSFLNKSLENKFRPLISKLENAVSDKHMELFGSGCNLPANVELIVSDELPTDKIGSYKHDSGIMTVAPKAFKDVNKAYAVILHELIHASLGKNANHDDKFQEFATAMGIPKKYQD